MIDSLFSQELLDSQNIVDWAYTEESNARTYHQFQNWIQKGDHGVLNYLTGDRGLKRSDLKLYYPDFQSALVFLFSYQHQKNHDVAEGSKSRLASYVTAFDGDDYHDVIKEQLFVLARYLEPFYPGIEFKLSLDTQPILERDLAYRSGLGWFGKNSMLISQKQGSYFLIGSLLLNQKLNLNPKNIDTDHCGQCQACIEACPTNAINGETRTLKANQCISTFTIEVFKEKLPPEGYLESRGEIFGCDICQDVCPWNKKILKPKTYDKSELALFFERPLLEIYEDLKIMSNNEFKRNFQKTPLERTGRVGVMKNIKPFLKINE